MTATQPSFRFTLPELLLTFRLSGKLPNEIVTDELVIIGRTGNTLTTAANEDALGEATVDVLQAQFNTLRGNDEFTLLAYHKQLVLVVNDLAPRHVQKAIEQAQRIADFIDARNFTSVTIVPPNSILSVDAEHAVGSPARLRQVANNALAPMEAFVYGLQLGNNAYNTFKSNARARNKATVTLFGGNVDGDSIARANAEAFGALLMKELVALPPNLMGTRELLDAAKQLAARFPQLSLKVLPMDELQAKGFGLLTAVGKASKQPTMVITLHYNNANTPLTALVGKGLVFDTGGISLKSNGGRGMKGDLGGAALVLGTLASLASTNAPANVVGVIGAVANDIGPDAYRPDDILTAYNGKTVEIDNTDAEGRLVLADCLTYAVRDLKAAKVFSFATLTAVERAIGPFHAGVFTYNQPLADSLKPLEDNAGEKVWQLPMLPEMSSTLSSTVADMVNTKGDPLIPSPIRGALFLNAFVDNTPYVHFDIGSVIDSTRSKYSWGVRLLSRLLRS